MLFDLRGRGRRTTVKVIYSFLAVLIGGGLVLFGIGGATGGGGLFDAINQKPNDASGVYSKQISSLKTRLAKDPKNQKAWLALTRAQVQQASIVGYDEQTSSYTKAGQAELEKASGYWKRYLALRPSEVDPSVAKLMVQAYGPAGLNQPKQAANALKDAIAAEKPNSAMYAQLAILSYQAGDKNQSKLAEERAVALAPKSKRKLIEADLAAQKAQVDAYLKQQKQQQQQGATGLGG